MTSNLDDEARARALVREVIREVLVPPTDMTLTEWSIAYGQLSKETSAKTGSFAPYPWQRGIMDAISDPDVEEVVVMKSARVGYTRCLDFAIGYFIHQDPSPILVVQPTLDDAKDYSKSEIVPMIRDIPQLAALAGDARAKTSGQTILNKTFSNGARLKFVGANSPSGFRRVTMRVVLFDEIDGFPAGAGSEGDQVKLGIKRTQTYWNRKVVLGSTPTIKGSSRIGQAYAATDQQKVFVPCPHCGERQALEWGGKDVPHGLKWKKNDKGEHLPETAFYVCRVNACIIESWEKPDMVAQGRFQPTQAARYTESGRRRVGLHVSTLYSTDVNASWAEIVREWLDSKDDPLLKQTFFNLVLGEVYEDRGDKALAEQRLASRTEVYAAEVPDGVAVLTVGGDTQDDRVELEIIGWGRNYESWSIAHIIIEGDPSQQEFWDQRVDPVLRRVWRRADGRGFEVAAVCLDSGGHHSQPVYDFSKGRLGRRIWAIKGESARKGAVRNPVWPIAKPSKRKKQGFRPVMIGVNAAKDSIRAWLHLDAPGPGYMHFPVDRDINYFAQLVSERLVLKEIGGRKFRVWELPPGRANEALDMRVYGYAALCGLIHFGFKLNKRADEVAATVKVQTFAQFDRVVEVEQLALFQGQAPTPEAAPKTPAPAAVIAQARPRRSIASKLAQ